MLAIESSIGVPHRAVGVTHIIEMKTVNIVIGNYLLYKTYNIFGRCRIAGLHIPLSLVMGTQCPLSMRE